MAVVSSSFGFTFDFALRSFYGALSSRGFGEVVPHALEHTGGYLPAEAKRVAGTLLARRSRCPLFRADSSPARFRLLEPTDRICLQIRNKEKIERHSSRSQAASFTPNLQTN